jgi:nitrate reductase NapE component
MTCSPTLLFSLTLFAVLAIGFIGNWIMICMTLQMLEQIDGVSLDDIHDQFD